MKLWKRLFCLSLLVGSLYVLQSGAFMGGLRSGFHKVIPVAQVGGIMPTVGGEDEESQEIRGLRLALVARENQLSLMAEQVAALTSFRGRYPDCYREVVPAPITFKRDSNHLSRTCYLGRGRTDGVELGDAVVWGAALVGQVFQVESGFCRARLLTDPMMRVPTILVDQEHEVGVLVGQGTSTCVLKFVPWTASVKPGMRLVTSGFGGEVPRGLVLGTVSEVTNDQSAPFLECLVEPAVDLDRIVQVLIVRREVIRPAPEDE